MAAVAAEGEGVMTTNIQVYRRGRWWWAVPIGHGLGDRFVLLVDAVSFDEGEG